MHRSLTTRCCRLALKSAAALALTIAPYQIAFDGSVPGIYAASAQAEKGGNGGGNSGGGNGGNSGGGNSGNSSSGNGNSGNAGQSGANRGKNDNSASHVKEVDVTGNKITVRHPDGITEKIENGRFRMEDAFGRTIIDRRATPADVSRLKTL
ncbi:hypothetical protein [Mesorhizobium sp. M1396]|uniref:hypothetical protein n=1 Tax=Mesorhizobium sp. M1396 TaxID=2957095 RepID=UPI00333D641F